MRYLKYGFLVAVLVAFGVSAAWAWGDSAECLGCHQDFGGPNETSHDLHNTFVESCGYCHTTLGPFDTPSTSSSALDPENSCSGCHTGGGTAERHIATTDETCGCHGDMESWPRGTEAFLPPYYDKPAITTLRFSCFDGIDNDGDLFLDGGDDDCIGVPTEIRSWTVIKDYYGSE
jgi:hypothetical protein